MAAREPLTTSADTIGSSENSQDSLVATRLRCFAKYPIDFFLGGGLLRDENDIG
jgi:hypothetical protein